MLKYSKAYPKGTMEYHWENDEKSKCLIHGFLDALWLSLNFPLAWSMVYGFSNKNKLAWKILSFFQSVYEYSKDHSQGKWTEQMSCLYVTSSQEGPDCFSSSINGVYKWRQLCLCFDGSDRMFWWWNWTIVIKGVEGFSFTERTLNNNIFL